MYICCNMYVHYYIIIDIKNVICFRFELKDRLFGPKDGRHMRALLHRIQFYYFIKEYKNGKEEYDFIINFNNLYERWGRRAVGRGGDRGRLPSPEYVPGEGHPAEHEVHRTSPRRNHCLHRGAASIPARPRCRRRRIPRQAATWQRRSQTLILSIINSTQKMRSYISSPPDMLCGPEISFYNFYNGRA